MRIQIPTVTLNDGIEMPQLGLGTYGIGNDEEIATAIADALELGYRLIDSAAAYENEEAVGEGVRRSGVPREEVFLTTKLANEDHGYEATQRALAASLERLGMDYVDLYLIHWPNPSKSEDAWRDLIRGTWRAFEEAQAAGKIRSIGVSNFEPVHFEALAETQKVVPSVNQIRFFPGVKQTATEDYCRRHNIVLEAYTPLGKGTGLLESELLRRLALKHGGTAAQVALRYAIERGYVPIPKSGNRDRMEENLGAFGISLDDAALRELDAVEAE